MGLFYKLAKLAYGFPEVRKKNHPNWVICTTKNVNWEEWGPGSRFRGVVKTFSALRLYFRGC
jgi:hypothetical protein